MKVCAKLRMTSCHSAADTLWTFLMFWKTNYPSAAPSLRAAEKKPHQNSVYEVTVFVM